MLYYVIYYRITQAVEAGASPTAPPGPQLLLPGFWILCRGGCSGSGVQWIWVVSYSKLV